MKLERARKTIQNICLNLNHFLFYLTELNISLSHTKFQPFNVATNSLPATNSLMMSNPPMSSPLTYTCGYVGQSEYVFSPCRTFSSVRMSNVSYGICVSFRMAISCLEKPQRGVFRSPFMNTITLARLINAFKRSFKLCAGPTVPEVSTAPTNDLHLTANAAILTPSMRSIALFSRTNKTVGTASI